MESLRDYQMGIFRLAIDTNFAVLFPKKILTFVPTPISPPGTAYIKSFCSANKDTILDRIGLQVSFPSESLDTRPGRTSISCPTLRTPKIVRYEINHVVNSTLHVLLLIL